MGEVAYLLGAGASAECLPIVSDMAGQIGELLKVLQPLNAKLHNAVSGDPRMRFVQRSQFCTELLKKLQKICEDHYSIDTYAKKLYLTNRLEFDKLKAELSFYFTIMQVLLPKDKRYDNFFASIINEKGVLPRKVKVLSWNYDAQFELSYSQFSYNAPLEDCRKQLNTYTPSDFDDIKKDPNTFISVKLNGTATFKIDRQYAYLLNIDPITVEDKLTFLYESYYEILNGSRLNRISDLKFAWENENYERMFRELATSLTNIEVLVVIGYSFPFFNREVDVALFKSLPNLHKIYIQDLYPEGIEETMAEFIDFEFHNIKTVHKKNLKQFVFPKELDITR